MSTLHDTDFYSWTQQQSALLRSASFAELDVTNLIEEIEDMGRSEKRELNSRLQVLLTHLLKWQYQSGLRGKSWRATIRGQRENIRQCLAESPGLKPSRNTALTTAYRVARFDAESETGLDESVFPESCPWSFDQAMADDFWPQ